MKTDNKIRSFTDLLAWKEGHKLVLNVYRITKSFPKDERFCLTDQMRRSVLSVTSNIAEGFSRPTKPDKKHFYYQALGSLTELQNQLLVSRDIGYLEAGEFSTVVDLTVSVSKLIRFLVRYLNTLSGP
ncbi:hypothetical protein A2Z33_04535 [Candidatus Gottesmanbacteria bacterium RBG_16_52_11]|uniref:Four helix bundle protein n=1 Tax=Candidatus Gottesmanbacteria bacterium RBG_16_52_11 TaxID=1798374 RepID=A0A1F5YNY9_9BACT|nr:MAG: hypothetical protein A2Z33_04535 [Candidatus Gottesmanbacteria bacterium RBG_16_52_11]